MQWQDQVEQALKSGKVYSHKELINALRKEKPGLADNTYQWAIRDLLKHQVVRKMGHNQYILYRDWPSTEYQPAYSEHAKHLIDILGKEYPYVSFTIFETVLMNEFLNHLVAQNTVFIQAEKESNAFLFRFLQEQGYNDLMYKPSGKDFSLYWAKDCIVVSDLISEAPLMNVAPHTICIEKLLVDMYADKLISTTYSKAEFPEVLHLALSQYHVDRTKMLRYARRRNRDKKLAQLLEGEKKYYADA